MTTAKQNRCIHCQSPYVYHPSFYGGDECNYPYDHHDYCEECCKTVRKALSEIPVKYEKKFVPSNNYSKEQIVQHQEERCKNGIEAKFEDDIISFIGMRRVSPTLIDMTGKTQHHIVMESMPDGEWYKAEWWSHKPEEVKTSKETWVKL